MKYAEAYANLKPLANPSIIIAATIQEILIPLLRILKAPKDFLVKL